MARKSTVPNALERRNVLYGSPKRPPDYLGLGERYLEQGRRSDALECFEMVVDEAQREAAIEKVKTEAIADGNNFLLNRINLTLPLKEKDWQVAARKAREQGKLQYALKSALRAEDEEMVAELREALGIKPEEPEDTDEVESEAESEAEPDTEEAQDESED